MIDLAAANHTNRELELMLAGKKPLAMFYAEISELPDERFIPDEAFKAFVTSGQFVRTEIEWASGYDPRVNRSLIFRYVFFALQGEEWRIPAMILLKESHAKSNCVWSETLERMSSALLGYSDEEVDAWCETHYRKPCE